MERAREGYMNAVDAATTLSHHSRIDEEKKLKYLLQIGLYGELIEEID